MTAGGGVTDRMLIRQLFMTVHRIVSSIRMTAAMLVADGRTRSRIVHGHAAIHAERSERLTQQ